MADEYLIDELAITMAAVERDYLADYLNSPSPLTTYAGLPDDPYGVTYPFTCGLFDRADFDPYRGKPHGDTMGGESAIDEYAFYFDRWCIVGDRTRNDMKNLEQLARRTPNLIRRCYLANINLRGKCSTAVPIYAVFDKLTLFGEKHFGVRYSVKVEGWARVRVGQSIPPP